MLSAVIMKISSNSNINKQSYKGLWNNKAVLKGLETISEHSTSFIAATTLTMSAGVRPVAIALTPDTDKKTKQYATTNAIASGLIKFALVEAIAIPIENAVKKIDKTPEKYLTSKTIEALKGNAKNLTQSKDYKFITQVLKQCSGLISALPKAMLTVALIPVIMNFLFNKNKKNTKKQKSATFSSSQHTSLSTKNLSKNNSITSYIYKETFTENLNKSSDTNPFNKNKAFSPSFKGGLSDTIARGIGSLLNKNQIQNIAKKFSRWDSDITKNISIATDLLLTASFIHQTNKSKKIDEDKKKPLIYNNLISTGITLLGGYFIDSAIKNNTQKFIDKFIKINKDNPKLNKYIEGINILRPTIIFAALYYGIMPVISTYLSDKIDKVQQNK